MTRYRALMMARMRIHLVVNRVEGHKAHGFVLLLVTRRADKIKGKLQVNRKC